MKLHIQAAVAALSILSAGSIFAGDATAPFDNSRIDARLNVTVKDDTQVLHFVRTSSDPDVITKTYVLKYADPYEIRGYLVDIVKSRKVNESDTGIQAIKYTDGTGILMVSAEDYRFEDSSNGQGIDSIIRELDKPKVVSSGGTDTYLYAPKYRDVKELAAMVRTAGAAVSDDITELIGGTDVVGIDKGLNLLFFDTTRFSHRNILNVLRNYDIPYPEVRAKITVYEIYAENDAKIGLDFQAWKNNDGIDLFNGGGRFMRNFASDGSALLKNGGWSDTKFLQFNPKWNTKYIDFLTSKGKAKVLHTSEITARNNTPATIQRLSQVFLTDVSPIENQEYEESYIYLENVAPDTIGLNARTKSGKRITIDTKRQLVSLTVLKMQKTQEPTYILRVKGGFFRVDGKPSGQKVQAGFVEVTEDGEAVEFTANNIPAEKGNTVNLVPSNQFGFSMTLTPAISSKATILKVNVNNSSLIGYTSTGEARIQKGAEVESDFMISNSGTKLVIGGIEKRDVVRVSGGIPILKDLPLLGWIFSTESESTKKSQLVVVAEVVPVRIGDTVPAADAAQIKKIQNKLKDAGESNTFGYRQFFIDSERLK
ncbi:MAG: hypothetical protein J6W81_02205 [Lentisphaeria bacterium]|nr:hypothetical protein [Lentisphaeria bacterium]